MKIAQICTAHGFGHTTRQLALAEELQRRGHQVSLFSAATHLLEKEAANIPWETMISDVGLVQEDSLHIDLEQTALRLKHLCSPSYRAQIAARLQGFDLALVDASPIAMEAAASIHLPVLSISNFDWAWIYEHYPELTEWAKRFASWQLKHHALFIPPGPGLFYFKSVTEAGLLCREATPFPLKRKSILVSFGGFGLNDIEQLLPKIAGVQWVFAPPNPAPQRNDFNYVEGVMYPDLIAGADIVFSKAGYGICAETARSGNRVLLLERDNFPEARSLEQFVLNRGGIVLPDLRSDPLLFQAKLREAVLNLLEQPAPSPLGMSGVHKTACLVEELAASKHNLNTSLVQK